MKLERFLLRTFKLIIVTIFIFVILNYILQKVHLKVAEQDYITFSFLGTVVEDDEFQVYYLSGDEKSFSGANSIKRGVIGSMFPQKIGFDLPLEKIKKIRFDIGTNINQKNIQFEKVLLSRYDSTLTIEYKEFSKLFNPNGFVEIDSSTQSVSTRIRKDLWADYDPFFTSIDLTNHFSDLQELEVPKSIIPTLLALLFSISFLLYLFIFQRKYSFINEPQDLYQTILIFLFLIVLIIPGLFFGRTQEGSAENVAEIKSPKFSLDSLKTFTKEYDNYFSKSFGFREMLIEGLSKIKINYFHESSVPDKVVIGNNGWMFLWGNYYNIEQDYLHTNLHTNEELISVFEVWNSRFLNLKNQNIDYYITYFPNKHTIYGENLPYRIRIQQNDTVSRAQQVMNYYKNSDSNLKILDITEQLIGKKDQKIYYRHDSHWNNLGAFFGYQELVSFLYKDIPEIGNSRLLSDYELTYQNETGGGLLKVLGLENDTNHKELKPFLALKENTSITSQKLSGFQGAADIDINNDAPNQLVLLVFRDSFFSALRPFLSQHFHKVVYVWSGYEQKVVDLIEPNIVLEANVERYFSGHIVK